MHAEKCPLCNGVGKVKVASNTTMGNMEKTCHGCFGMGWVTIPDLDEMKELEKLGKNRKENEKD